jgi:Ca2+-binding RTX toxin-like protein
LSGEGVVVAVSTVTNSEALGVALRSAAAGDTILLAPGLYAPVDIRGAKFAGQVTIASADPNNMAKLQGLKVDGDSTNLTFSRLDITVHYDTGFAVAFGNTSNIKLLDSRIHGAAVGDKGGLGIFTSTNVVIVGNEFAYMQGGIAHRDSTNVLIQDNTFHDLQSDAISGTNATNIDIVGNYFTDFFPASGHIDVIQFYKTGTNTSRDITVADNIFVRGAGAAVQGIFIGNENQIAYETVTVTGNAIIGAQYHGISIDQANNATVTGNLVEGYTDMASWLGVWRSTNSVVANNQATVFNLHSNTNVVVSGSAYLAAPAPGDFGILSIWRPATAEGGEGADTLLGRADGDVVRGFGGDDLLSGGEGRDDLNGNAGADTVFGGGGSDTVRGGKDSDLVMGDDGDDGHVNGNLGADTVHGGAGADTVYGGQGADWVYGDDGADRLSGDLGDDSLIGGAGPDRFGFGLADGADLILDFNGVLGDRVLLPKAAVYTISDLAGSARIDLGGASSITLSGISASGLGEWVVLV